MLLNYDAGVNYVAAIRGLLEKEERLDVCIDLLGCVTTYLYGARDDNYPRDQELVNLGNIIVELITLCESVGVSFDELVVMRVGQGSVDEIIRNGHLVSAMSLMHWADRVTLAVLGGESDEAWLRNELSFVIPMFTSQIAALAQHLNSNLHQCTYYSHDRLKAEAFSKTKGDQGYQGQGSTAHTEEPKYTPSHVPAPKFIRNGIQDYNKSSVRLHDDAFDNTYGDNEDTARDPRVIDRDDPACEAAVHELLTATPRDPSGQYITIQAGAFNVPNKLGNVYRISEKDLVEMVGALHGHDVGEVSQSDVITDMSKFTTLLERVERLTTIKPEKSVGVLTDSAVVRQHDGKNEWLNVLATVRLNPKVSDLFENTPKDSFFGIRALTLPVATNPNGGEIASIQKLVGFDLLAESVVHACHQFKRSHGMKPFDVNNISKLSDVVPFKGE